MGQIARDARMKFFNSIQGRVIFFLAVMLLASFALSMGYFSLSLTQFAQDSANRTEKNIYGRRKSELQHLVSLGYTTITRFYDESKNLEKLKQRKHDELKKILDAVYSQALNLYTANKDTMPQAELEQTLASMVAAVRYDGGNYIWINDMTPAMIMHPIKPALNGQDLSGFKDPAGTPLFNEMVTVCKKYGEGVVSYMWTKPGEQEPKPKISYVRLLPGLNWIFGTGAWLEDIEEQMQVEALEALRKMRLPDGGYFWINDTSRPTPNMIMHPTSPGLDGKPLDNPKYKCATQYQDGLEAMPVETDGTVNLFAAMVTATEGTGKGFVTYLWPKPVQGGGVTDARLPKLSYVQRFEPWGWIIGMGVYIDDISASVGQERDFFHKHIRSTLTGISGANLFIAAVLGMAFIWLFRRDVNIPLSRLTDFAKEVDNGNLEARIDGRFIGRIGNLKLALEAMRTSVKENMEKSNESAKDAKEQADKAESTLTRVQDHVGQLNKLLDRMNEVAKAAMQGSKSMTAKAEELSTQFRTVTDGAEDQRNTLNKTMVGMNEMHEVVLNVASNAAEAASSADDARNTANNGAAIVDDAVRTIAKVRQGIEELKLSMAELGGQADAVGKVMNVITDIADQTNLLALNAAIEAARAGEAGRGFSVVADEVRKLAEKTMDATSEVGENIRAIQNSAQVNITRVEASAKAAGEASEKANLSGSTLSEIVDLVSSNAAQVTSIASASEEQSATTEEMGRNIELVNDIASRTVTEMAEAMNATRELSLLAEETRKVIASLKE